MQSFHLQKPNLKLTKQEPPSYTFPRMNIIAPLSGIKLPLASVPDPVFAQKMVGDGVAIDPVDQVLISPVDGTVVQLHASRHAITVSGSDGVQVLMHIGIDTVNLKGEGFVAQVKVGDKVKVGQPLISFDADLIAQKAKSLITMVIVPGEKVSAFGSNSKEVKAGQDILFEVGKTQPSSPSASSSAKPGSAESAFVKVNLPQGMHARPAALIVSMAKNYESDIEVIKGDRRGNAKSVIGWMSLEIGLGDEVRFSAKGSDAEKAVTELAELIQDLREEADKVPVASTTATRVRSQDPNILSGVGISPGLALGRVHQIRATTFKIVEKSNLEPGKEKDLLNKALFTARQELAELMAQVKNQTDGSRAAIFAAHQELLNDPDLLSESHSVIDQGKTAGFAWQKTTEEHASRLAQLNNELLANRANDLRDVSRRVLKQLVPSQQTQSTALPDNCILIAENLTPSETVQLDRSKVVGFCTTTGGATSHVAILARSLGLPALAGADPKVLDLEEGSEIILDGENGELKLNPSPEQKREVERLQKESLNYRKEALSQAHQHALTQDGERIEVAANIGSVEDARQAVELGADGVGLLRSEFLFLERDNAPSEDEQFRVYQEIADVLEHRPLVIRTLDVGGDKPLRYLPMPAEENPFLGVRGIRIGLARPEILRTQLRALLRVKSKGQIHIMFPMISTLEEWHQAKQILEEERIKLNVPSISVGIMVEVPSAALIAEAFAQEVDFFSIGTNDLTQYTLAMDRGHKDLAKQVDALHPSVLKLIEMTAKAGLKYGKWVGVCGGLASDLNAVGLLIGLGVRELSVSIPSIPLVKSKVRDVSLTEAQGLAQQVINCKDGAEVRDSLKTSGKE